MITIHACFGQWDHHRAAFGIADYLRCAAMSAIDAGYGRDLYTKEAVARGYHYATAVRCWYYVQNQGK